MRDPAGENDRFPNVAHKVDHDSPRGRFAPFFDDNTTSHKMRSGSTLLLSCRDNIAVVEHISGSVEGVHLGFLFAEGISLVTSSISFEDNPFLVAIEAPYETDPKVIFVPIRKGSNDILVSYLSENDIPFQLGDSSEEEASVVYADAILELGHLEELNRRLGSLAELSRRNPKECEPFVENAGRGVGRIIMSSDTDFKAIAPDIIAMAPDVHAWIIETPYADGNMIRLLAPREVQSELIAAIGSTGVRAVQLTEMSDLSTFEFGPISSGSVVELLGVLQRLVEKDLDSIPLPEWKPDLRPN